MPGVVDVLRRKFQSADVAKARLVVAATDDEALHARIHKICEARGIWVNVVDRPAFCSFIVPAVVRRGPVTFAVSTGGTSPALAKALAERLHKLFGPEVGAAARVLGDLRPRLRALPMEARKRLLEPALARAARSGFGARALKALRGEISRALKSAQGEKNGKS
jgi:siroheme synthase-like protein